MGWFTSKNSDGLLEEHEIAYAQQKVAQKLGFTERAALFEQRADQAIKTWLRETEEEHEAGKR
ncbi:hypothetical protein [Streptomyces sp. NPDC088196]|uniref:hypothetical protein n=1 Tax=Streptomyces sp. NPDC088196 TaxID=3154868 RepID=UPI00344F3961